VNAAGPLSAALPCAPPLGPAIPAGTVVFLGMQNEKLLPFQLQSLTLVFEHFYVLGDIAGAAKGNAGRARPTGFFN
jgi:hypothetical protein